MISLSLILQLLVFVSAHGASELIGYWPDYPVGSSYQMAANNNRLYVASGVAGLTVIDVTNPSAPARLSGYQTDKPIRGVALIAGYAVVVGEGGLEVLSVRDPSHIVSVGKIATLGYGWMVTVEGEYAYVAEGWACGSWRGMEVVHIADPSAPHTEGHWAIDSGVTGNAEVMKIQVAGGYAYIAAKEGGLRIIDIRDPSHPIQAGSLQPSGPDVYSWPEGLDFSGHYAILACCLTVEIVDVADPAHPVRVGIYNVDDHAAANDISIVGNLALVAGGSFKVLDISHPDTPTLVGRTYFGSDFLEIDRDSAFLSENGHLYVLDFGNPSSPRLLESLQIPGDVRGLQIVGRIVYLASGPRGLAIARMGDSIPFPDLRANGSDGLLVVNQGIDISISASLNPGGKAGENADWWAVTATPFGWYYYNMTGWVPGLMPTYQGALFSLDPFTAFNGTGLPPGTYMFFFGVDTNMNGQLDMDQIYYDYVQVTVI
jgi:hypothetical protein